MPGKRFEDILKRFRGASRRARANDAEEDDFFTRANALGRRLRGR